MLTDRRDFLKLFGTFAVAGPPCSASYRDDHAVRSKPNVLFVAVDDLRTSLGCYGDGFAKSPNIDALAYQGVRFARAYCQQAVCNPSRQSLLTGRRPDTIRVWNMTTSFRQTSPGVVPLPEHFKNNGYFAQSLGKIYHGVPPMADPQSWSVPEQFQYTPKRDFYLLPSDLGGRKWQKEAATEDVCGPDAAYPDGKVAAAAIRALRRFSREGPQRPFFLAVGFRKPHLPFTAPKRYWDMYDASRLPPIQQPGRPDGASELEFQKAEELRGYRGVPKEGLVPEPMARRLRLGYYAALSYTDAQIGRVLGALRETGLDRTTIIVFWADHGYHLGEQTSWCKDTNFESDTHVPLIVVNPFADKKAATCNALVEHLDIYPTLCEMCGLPPAEGLEGKSLTPWLKNPDYPSPKAAFSQFPRPWFYHGSPEYMGYAVRTDSYRYIEWRKFGTQDVTERELYHLAPGQQFETANLANDPGQKARIQQLSEILHLQQAHRPL